MKCLVNLCTILNSKFDVDVASRSRFQIFALTCFLFELLCFV